MKELVHIHSRAIMRTLLDITLVVFTWLTHKIIGLVILSVKYEVVKEFFTETRDFMSWVVSILVFIKVVIDLKKTVKESKQSKTKHKNE